MSQPPATPDGDIDSILGDLQRHVIKVLRDPATGVDKLHELSRRLCQMNGRVQQAVTLAARRRDS